jgi:hypothetical protein
LVKIVPYRLQPSLKVVEVDGVPEQAALPLYCEYTAVPALTPIMAQTKMAQKTKVFIKS